MNTGNQTTVIVLGAISSSHEIGSVVRVDWEEDVTYPQAD